MNHNALSPFAEELAAMLEQSVANRRKTYDKTEFYAPAKVRTKPGAAALDHCVDPNSVYGAMGTFEQYDAPGYVTPFIGYERIAELRTDIIYQNIITSYAEEMTSKWLDLETSDSEAISSDLLKEIQDEALNVWRLDAFIRETWETYFGWDGGGLVFIDIKGHTSDKQLEEELIIDPEHIGAGDLLGFRPVEAINCQPYDYEAVNPLSPDYYNPRYWLVMGKKVHRSRFLHFAQNRLPSLLRPAYNFFGVPIVQMLEPYRQGFDRARLASLDSIDNHALLYLKTDMNKALQSGRNEPMSLWNRLKLLILNRTNNGVAACDKDTEDFAQINTPLTDLAGLVTLNLELIPMVTRMPVTKMFGTPPKGLDASGDNYRYDRAETIMGMQKNILHDNVARMYQLIMLNKWGTVFSPITYRWKSTLELTEEEKLQARERQANIDTQYLSGENPPLHPFEIRARLSKDTESGYYGIAVPEDYEDAFEAEWEEVDEGGEETPQSEFGPGQEGEEKGQDRDKAFGEARDEFKEEDHPRDEGGKFGKGSGDSGKDSGGSEGDVSDVSEWGEAYTEFTGKPAEAIDHLMHEKRGYVPGAFHRDETGPIDLPYGKVGKDGFGVAHIIERRNQQGYDGEAFVRGLPEIISEGVYVEKDGFPNKRFIAHEGKEAAIRLDWNRKSRTWIASAYYLFDPEKKDKTLALDGGLAWSKLAMSGRPLPRQTKA